MMPTESELIYDWNQADSGDLMPARGKVEIDDETLRDGLQSPSVVSPPIEDKLRILHLLGKLGIESVDIGLPGAGPHVASQVERLAKEIVDQKLPIQPNCAARTVRQDIVPIVEASQKAGIAIEAACFIGSSPVRQYAEGWTLDKIEKLAVDAISFAVSEGLPVMFVTEDTTRSAPDDLRRLFRAAVDAGASRVCIADTVGHSTPAGAAAIVRFTRDVVGDEVMIDWHGHRDRGLGEINSLAAAGAGADRLHGCILGIGERVGNTATDLLLVNMVLMGWIERDLAELPALCDLVAATTGVALPDNYPVVGRDAFRTGTGVHAAAILKAIRKGDDWLADRIYSGVPAGLIGRRQVVEVGPMSGESNVVFWLESQGIPSDATLVRKIFEKAKESDRVLEEEEILAVCHECGVAATTRG